MIKKVKWFSMLCAVVFLVGCDGIGQIPAEKMDYIGKWHGQHMVLSISPNAKVDYEYEKESSSKSISAPIIEFIGNDFKVGVLGIDTVFIVSQPPYLEDGVWKMVIDDQLVQREAITQ